MISKSFKEAVSNLTTVQPTLLKTEITGEEGY
jgi:hypothetical protein